MLHCKNLSKEHKDVFTDYSIYLKLEQYIRLFGCFFKLSLISGFSCFSMKHLLIITQKAIEATTYYTTLLFILNHK